MRICFTELMVELSHALDYVERDLLGVKTNHGKRVAYLCALMGKKAGLDDWQLSDLVACSVLHDNALSEYIQTEYLSTGRTVPGIRETKLGIHCTMGERNVKGFPFFGEVKNAILYHHEHADGTGPFSKKAHEIPFYAALIHLADQLDAKFSLRTMNEEKLELIRKFVVGKRGVWFGEEEADLCMEFLDVSLLGGMRDECIEETLRGAMPYIVEDYAPERMTYISGIFARIVDYKSTFTSLHSMGIAHKAHIMASHYGCGEEECAKMFLAGALHDIGKLAVDVDILEKPDKLTGEEFEQIKNHAFVTYEILSRVSGLEDICRWASYHHEKLNGRGYPFGYDGTKLDRNCRLMGCLDIYQALREDRPYKKGLSHGKTMSIMREMVDGQFIDGGIVEDIDAVFQDESDG